MIQRVFGNQILLNQTMKKKKKNKAKKYVEELAAEHDYCSIFICRMMECKASGNTAFAACKERQIETVGEREMVTEHESDGEEEKNTIAQN